ncbi:MAG: hypothetical protein LBQ60_08580 [Bacteroidales bacterium]|jgi:hypothetical protein|nr:hypothetical protein [Bacteroidales bacterium]
MMRTFLLLIVLAAAQYSFAQTASELKSKLPEISGWDIDPNVETFDQNTLFERINGAAGGYLLYDFEELISFVYNQVEEGENVPYITIQVYRHATPADAFGIYAAERPSQANFLQIGAEGYQEGPMLNFFVDRLYVKMESPSSSDHVIKTVEEIARKFGKSIRSKPKMPEILQAFPTENKMAHSEMYVPKSFLGHEFLSKAFTAVYELSGKSYQVFIINAENSGKAKEMLEKYYGFTKQADSVKEGRLTIKDRYNGDLECIWKGQYIWGILNDNQIPLKTDEILKEVGKRL